MAANVPVAIAADRNRLVSTRYGMKTSGMSLIPAAMPTAAPLSRRLSGCATSPMMSAISSRLTCPRYMVRNTGSVSSAAALPSSAAPSLVRHGIPRGGYGGLPPGDYRVRPP